MGIFNRLNGSTSSHSESVGEDSGDLKPYAHEGDNYFDASEALLHEHAHPLGGLGCPDPTLREEQQKAISDWISRLGKRLLTGNGLASTPAPVIIFEPRSYLQKVTDPWCYTEYLLEAARADCKLKRMQLVVAWFVAGLRHVFDTWRKPFNPVLGETWQSVTSNGCRATMEQISHHPPITAYTLTGKGFRMCGSAEPGVTVCIKHRGFKQAIKGPRRIEFDDGDVLEFLEMPVFTTKGVIGSTDLRGDVGGQAVLQLQSKAGSLTAHITFGAIASAPESFYRRTDALEGYIVADDESLVAESRQSSHASDSMQHSEGATGPLRRGSRAFDTNSEPPMQPPEVSGPFKLFGAKRNKKSARGSDATPKKSDGKAYPNNMLPAVTQVSSWLRNTQGPHLSHAVPASAIARFQGNWLSHLDFFTGDEPTADRMWALHSCNATPFESVAEGKRLPSDCTFRNDMQLLANGDIKAAEAAKQEIEDRQRKERKLRSK